VWIGLEDIFNFLDSKRFQSGGLEEDREEGEEILGGVGYF